MSFPKYPNYLTVKALIFCFRLSLLYFCLGLTPLAHADQPCAQSEIPAELQSFRQSKDIRHLKYVKSQQTMSGQIGGLGSFQSQLYACDHQGIHLVFTFEQILDEVDLQKKMGKALGAFARPIFGKSATKFLANTQSFDYEKLSKSVSLDVLAGELGRSEIKLQILEVEGMYMLSIKAWGG
ncbi:MAG: hypothetical protein QE278_13865 [Limnobacter sp.]|nr:hypothetical protein [Limnobacter sp.]